MLSSREIGRIEELTDGNYLGVKLLNIACYLLCVSFLSPYLEVKATSIIIYTSSVEIFSIPHV